MRNSIFTTIIILAFVLNASAQKKISFIAPDNLKITADLYDAGAGAPVIILCHEANSSRGEFKNAAPKLLAMGFTCLAIDMRAGGTTNGIANETTPDAIEKKFPIALLYGEQDMLAAITYAEENLKAEKIILLGSSYSAGLALMIGAYDDRIAAIAVFSPGEYIEDLSVSTYVQYITKPTFATGASSEISDVRAMMAGMNEDYLVLFSPSGGGVHGAKNLDQSTPNHKEYWSALEKFLKKL
jgi:pimeloyl-ACP methyl ester carboxylesterase